MTNMDDFEKGVALILAKLYQTFPQGVVIYTDQLESGASDETLKNYSGTIQFLTKEGFISCGSMAGSGRAYQNVVLTTKGLQILNAVPDAIKDKKPIGEKIIESLKSGSKETLKIIVNQIISLAATTYIGTPKS
jgi:hypothetical protein